MKKKKKVLKFLIQLLVSIIMLFVAYKFGDELSKKLQSKIDEGNGYHEWKLVWYVYEQI